MYRLLSYVLMVLLYTSTACSPSEPAEDIMESSNLAMLLQAAKQHAKNPQQLLPLVAKIKGVIQQNMHYPRMQQQMLYYRAELHYLEAYHFHLTGDKAAVFNPLLHSIVDAEKTAHTEIRQKAYNLAGNLYEEAEDYENALVYLIKAHDLAPLNSNARQITMGNLARVQFKTGNLEEAHQLYQELSLSHTPHKQATGYSGLALIANATGQHLQQIAHNKKALEAILADTSPNTQMLANIYNNTGQTHQKLGNYQEALMAYSRALDLNLQTKDITEYLKVRLNISRVHNLAGDPALAMKLLAPETLEKEFSSGEYPQRFAKIYEFSANLLQKGEQYNQALIYAQKRSVLLGIVEQRKFQALQEVQALNAAGNQAAAAVDQEVSAALQSQRLGNTILMCILGIGILLGLSIIRQKALKANRTI